VPLVLALALTVPLALAWGLPRLAGRAEQAESAAAPDPEWAGRPGVGDPYFPDYGSSGYDATRYAIAVDWEPDTETLRGSTGITARATSRLESFYVDLALDVDRVLVEGRPAAYEREGFADVRITPAEPVPAGAVFEVEIGYAGQPGDVRRGKTTPWYETNQEWTVAGEPESSAWWFPANDHPSDPAMMDVSIRVPVGMEAISVGRLVSADAAAEPDHDTWRWVASEPMATYLNFVSIGQYAIEQGRAGGRPYVYAVSEQLPAPDRERALTALRRTSVVVPRLEALFGRYPFGEVGGVVPAHKLGFAGLETQTRPLYDRKSILDAKSSETLLVHELAHMWFGNHVTVAQWNDIFLNEAYASWAQWAYEERAGGRRANDRLNRAYERTRNESNFWRVRMIDPGPDHLFDVVYVRGPMTLQALRNVIGDEAFLGLARRWASQPGSRSVEEWMVTAQAATPVDLAPFFRAWLLADSAPARTAGNGFR